MARLQSFASGRITVTVGIGITWLCFVVAHVPLRESSLQLQPLNNNQSAQIRGGCWVTKTDFCGPIVQSQCVSGVCEDLVEGQYYCNKDVIQESWDPRFTYADEDDTGGFNYGNNGFSTCVVQMDCNNTPCLLVGQGLVCPAGTPTEAQPDRVQNVEAKIPGCPTG